MCWMRTSRLPSHTVICSGNVIVGQVSPRHRLGGAEQARKAAHLGFHVLLAALDDQLARRVGREDLGVLIARGAEHAHRMVVRQQHVA